MNRQIDYKTMRAIVGLIAILLAPMMLLLTGFERPLSSISISYWTDARDVFVGALIAVGFFLSAYNGSGNGRDYEYFLSKAACFFAICVALFPTTGFTNQNLPPRWVSDLAGFFGLMVHHIHNGAAVLLFGCLIVMMWLFSDRAMRKGKKFRAYVYRTISGLMLFGIISLGGLGYAFKWPNVALVVEVWGLTLFGAGWLLAGIYKTEHPAPA